MAEEQKSKICIYAYSTKHLIEKRNSTDQEYESVAKLLSFS